MKLTTTLSTLILALGLATAGCSKQKDTPTADKPAGETPKPTEAKPAAETPKPTEAKPAKPAAPAASGEVKFASDDEYIAEGKAAVGKFGEVFKAAGTDCDKLARGLEALAADPKIIAANAYEKEHPQAKKKFEEVAKAEGQKVSEAAGPAMKACANNKAVGEAMKKLGN